jgi:RimJ/RimL family protein N-acetyltransferase
VFVERSSGQVIGYGGYAGPPQDGVVEIGYSVLPDARGGGVATAAARALVEQARERGAARCIAHTLPEDNPSTTVLEHCGFVRAGWGNDPDEGAVWRWEITL